ncbi:MAG: hypothetical protein J6X53_01665 [Abditibacteriota bacterium]|nr:hypothetical protein [Abditibacteriota bacterium]
MNTKLTKTENRPDTVVTRRRRAQFVKRLFESAVCLTFALALTVVPALATGGDAGDGGAALAAVNNLSTFIFALIRAIGLILLGYGILQVGLSFQSHDPSQRSNGILTIAGGIIIVFTKEILDLITA